MFLATTADQRFWKQSEKVLFLGEWCRTFDQKSVWSKLDHEILPYHWESRDQFFQDYQNLNQLYERVLPLFAENLNDLHNENHSLRYWRIILSPWLYYFIQTFYDRYLSVRHAIDSGKATLTWIPPLIEADCIPKDFPTFQKWQAQDDYNLYLYSWLIRELARFPVEIQDNLRLSLKRLTPGGRNLKGQIKQGVKKVLGAYSRIIPEKMKNIMMASLYMDPVDAMRLQVSLGQLPNPFTPNLVPEDMMPDLALREKFKFPLGEIEFESLLSRIIFMQIPMSYLEAYSQLKIKARKVFPKKAKVVISVNAHFGNEGFKIWCADQVENKARLIGSQHGGHYGNALWSSNETHEIKVADRYFSWGWENEKLPSVAPHASPQLMGIRKRIRCDSGGGILWLGMSRPRYSGWMVSAPVGLQMLDYIEEQKIFLKGLDEEARDLLVMRLFHEDYGWGVKARLNDSIPDLRFHDGSETMYQQLCQSRLCIGTYNATTNLETISANFPTVAFWNFDHWKLRESARPYFESLCEVGVFHDSPESAARKVNEVCHDPLSWWNSSVVQKAINRFCQRFARTSKSWSSEWKKEILEIAGE